MRLDQLAGARIGLLGFGREGRAFQRALHTRGLEPDVTVLAERAPEQAPDPWPLRVGPLADQEADFEVLVRSPGVPFGHPFLTRCREQGAVVVSPSSIWFAERPDARVIAVTGSKGKSTTAALIAHLLSHAGLETVLAGNIGIPLLAHLETRADWFVAELSSYQLVDLSGNPRLGVVTRLFPEHGDWHGGTEGYFAAKLRLLELLEGGPLVINGADPLLLEASGGYPNRIEANRPPRFESSSDGIYQSGRKLLDAEDLNLIGSHNLDNLALALAVGDSLGLDPVGLADAARSFRPLAHRLEVVSQSAGARWINDSIATTPHATRAALEAFSGVGVILIAGGQERGGDWQPVLDHCRARPLHGLVSLPDNGPAIARKLVTSGAVPAGRVRNAENLFEAVAAALDLVPSGGVVLLSPGAPSFPHFRDFEDRGEQFRRLVGELKTGNRKGERGGGKPEPP